MESKASTSGRWQMSRWGLIVRAVAAAFSRFERLIVRSAQALQGDACILRLWAARCSVLAPRISAPAVQCPREGTRGGMAQ